MKVTTKLLNEITFDKVRPYIHTSRTRIRKYNVGLVIHRIRKIVRRSEKKVRKPPRRYCYEIVSEFPVDHIAQR